MGGIIQKSIMLFTAFLTFSFSSFSQTIYVDVAAAGSNNGTSWTNAFTDLQDALDSNMSGGVDTILVAEGTYYPTSRPDNGNATYNRNFAFHLADSNVVVLGGYDAGIGTRTGNSTILSGDVGTLSDSTDNCFHVIITIGLNNSTVLDLITVTLGNANGSGNITFGSLLIDKSQGAGMFNRSSSPTITNSTFVKNNATFGAGMYNKNSSPVISNNSFIYNTATTGGGMRNATSSPFIFNSTFVVNTATNNGGGMYNNSSSLPQVKNSLLYGNTASNGNAIYNSNSSLHSASTNNATDNDSALISGGGLIDSFFVDLSSTHFKEVFKDSSNWNGIDNLWGTSDDGLGVSKILNSGASGVSLTTDITGYTRNVPPSIGAYEYIFSCNFSQRVIYVDSAATGFETGTSWGNAFTKFQDALYLRMACNAIDTILIAEGTYYPTSTPGDPADVDPRNFAFHLADSNVVILGGYDMNTGTQIGESVLSGDVGTVNDSSDNCYHIFVSTDLESTTVMDNLTIAYGNANGATNSYYVFDSQNIYKNQGGGMYLRNSDQTITNTSIKNNTANFGGGVYNSGSSPSITNSLFIENQAMVIGGGMHNSFCNSTITNCAFINNSANYDAGGIYNFTSSQTISNTIFIENNALSGEGGGIYNYTSSNPSIINCTFIMNTATEDGGGTYNYINSTPIIQNSLYFKNTANRGKSVYNSGASLSSLCTNIASDKDSGKFSNGGSIDSFFVDLSAATYTDLFTNSNDWNGPDDLWGTSDDGLFVSIILKSGKGTVAPAEDMTGYTRASTPSIGAHEHIPCSFARSVIYVDSSASGFNTGSSWDNAFNDLQSALDLRMECGGIDTIQMAQGTYFPTSRPDNGNASFGRNYAYHLTDSNVVIEGGYNPNTGTRTGGPTILDGDVGTLNDSTDNCFHVLVTTHLNNSTVFSHLTLTNGNANGSGSMTYASESIYKNTGGGMINTSSNPSITHSTFVGNTANFGAGLYNNSSNPTITGTSFIQNTAVSNGGGIYNYSSSSPSIINATFISNAASIGGGIYNSICSPSVTNTSFIENNASHFGGGIYNTSGTSVLIRNTSFYENTANSGPAIYGNSSSVNSASTHNASDADSALLSNAGTVDSFFIDLSSSHYKNLFADSSDWNGPDDVLGTTDDGLRLVYGSVLIGAGKNAIAPVDDITGFLRTTSPSIGAYDGLFCQSTSVLPISLNTTYSSSVSHTDDDGWTHYCTSNNELLLSLYLGSSGAVVAADEVQLKTGSSTTFSTTNTGGLISNPDGYAMIDRRWDVAPTTNVQSDSVGVRYYYTSAEYNDVVTALANHANPSTVTAVTQLNMFKATSGNAFDDPHTVSGIVLLNHSAASTSHWNEGNHGSDHIAEFYVSSFSGGGGGGGAGGGAGAAALPVDLIEFTAVATSNHHAHLHWETASEINNSHFMIERRYENGEFEYVSEVSGNGTTSQLNSYDFVDFNINRNDEVVYYRLTQVDYDGTNTFSPIRAVNFTINDFEIPTVTLFPNPSKGRIHIVLFNGSNGVQTVNVYNHQGKEMLRTEFKGQQGLVDLTPLPKGLYFIIVDGKEAIKLLKQ